MKTLLQLFAFGIMIPLCMAGTQFQNTDVFVGVGSQAVLPCECHPSSPYPHAVTWKKSGSGTVWRKQRNGLQFWGFAWMPKETQRAQCPHYRFERGDYSLEINSVQEEDGGIYTCTVDNGGHIRITTVTLRIIKVTVSPSVPMLENDFSVRCNVAPWPRSATLQWMLNGISFAQTEINPADAHTKSVVKGRAAERLAGNWTCLVTYNGKVGRASATLTLKGIIQPLKDNSKVYAAVGSAVTLPCVFSPGLILSNTVWEKLQPGSHYKPAPSGLLLTRPSQSAQSSSDASAMFKEVWFEDAGTYRCSGTVASRRFTRNMQLVVAKIDSSSPTKKGDSVTLTCHLSDTSQVTSYEWVHVVYDNNGIPSVGSIQKGKSLRVSNGSEGEWTCRFYGKEGILGNVTQHVPQMSGLSRPQSSGTSQNTGVTVGLSLLLIVLLLVVYKMYKNYQRRRKIFQYPALETIVHTISNEREKRERNREKQ